MDRSDLNLAYARADEENDDRRLEELQRAEQTRSVSDLEYKYLEGDSPEDEGESALQERAKSALGMAVDEALRDSLRSVADAEDPETVLRQEIAHAEGHATEELASALRELRPSDE